MLEERVYVDRRESLLLEGQNSFFYADLETLVIALVHSLGISFPQKILANLASLWLPLALDLATRRTQIDRTLIQGILGSQGTGKTTLCLILQQILNYLGFTVATLSIDDLYLTYEERQDLQQQDPRLIWRGPPGTHDVALGIELIELCLTGDSASATQVLLPRFDKSAYSGAGDRTTAEAIAKPDILLFEGWFVGVYPLAKLPDSLPLPLITAEDRQFALDNNKRLAAYVPLWNKLDSLIVLYPEDYHLSKKWRTQAEHKMKALGKTGMTDQQIDSFVEYFWRSLHPELFIKPLIKTADLVIEVKEEKQERVFRLQKKASSSSY
ncbi:MAG: glycerate kinase [Cyanobacteria bacterium P01_C01_bin.72]